MPRNVNRAGWDYLFPFVRFEYRVRTVFDGSCYKGTDVLASAIDSFDHHLMRFAIQVTHNAMGETLSGSASFAAVSLQCHRLDCNLQPLILLAVDFKLKGFRRVRNQLLDKRRHLTEPEQSFISHNQRHPRTRAVAARNRSMRQR